MITNGKTSELKLVQNATISGFMCCTGALFHPAATEQCLITKTGLLGKLQSMKQVYQKK